MALLLVGDLMAIWLSPAMGMDKSDITITMGVDPITGYSLQILESGTPIFRISVEDMLVGLVNSVDTEHKRASTVSSKSDNSRKDSQSKTQIENAESNNSTAKKPKLNLLTLFKHRPKKFVWNIRA